MFSSASIGGSYKYYMINYVDSPTVTITVGEGDSQRVYSVHRRILTEASEYFRTDLDGGFSESHSHDFKLKEDDPEAFRVLAAAVYTSVEDVMYELNFHEDADSMFSMGDCLHLHARAFAPGNKLMAAKFKQDLVWNLCSFLAKYSYMLIAMPVLIDSASVVYGWTSTADGWEMRKVLALCCAARLRDIDGVKPVLGSCVSQTDRNNLAACSLEKFIADVLWELQHVKLPAFDGLAPLLYPGENRGSSC